MSEKSKPTKAALKKKADSLHKKGEEKLEAGKFSEAIPIYEEAVKLRRQLSDSGPLCDALNKASEVYTHNGEYKKALELAKEALLIGTERLSGKGIHVADSYYNIGSINRRLGNYKKALQKFRKALEIQKVVLGPKHIDVARSYNAIGLTYADIGSYRLALENYERALQISQSILGKESPEISVSFNNIAGIYFELGRYDLALMNYKEALEIRLRAFGEGHPDVALCYNNIGTVYVYLGEYNLSLENGEKALNIFLKYFGPEHPAVATCCNNMGVIYRRLGFYQLALDKLNKALNIRLKNLGHKHPSVAESYNNIGVIYDTVGAYQKALSNFKKALTIRFNALGEKHPSLAESYHNIGNAYSNLGRYQLAMQNLKKALKIWSSTLSPQHPRVAYIYNDLGFVYRKLDEYKTSLKNHEKALKIRLDALGEDHPDVAYSYNNIAGVYLDLEMYELALDNFEKALEIRINILGHDHPDVSTSYYGVGRVLTKLSRNEKALSYLKESIDIFEKSRAKIKSATLRESYTKTVTEHYEAIINLLLKIGRPEEAFSYLERSKSKVLMDSLQDRYDIDFGKGTMKEKLAESKRLAMKTEALEKQLIDEKSKPEKERNETKVENLSKLVAETKAEYLKVAAQIRTDPDYAFAVQVHPSDVGLLRSQVPPNQNLLMTYSAQDSLYLFQVTSQGFEVRSVPVSHEELNDLIHQCRNFCSGQEHLSRLNKQGKLLSWSWDDDGSDFYKKEVAPFKQVLTELYDCLVKPMETELADAEVVTFIPSGYLYYLPWGALLDAESGKFLSEKYNWNVLTSTELWRCIQRRKSKAKPLRSLALVGNPAGAKLECAEDEVECIKQSYRESTLLVGEQASEPGVVEIAPQSHVLHLATHGCLDTVSPWDSYIHLAPSEGSDGHWTATSISGESWKQMQLVTLSACQTALGGERPGLEFETLAKAFSFAMEGSPPSIIATLWPVADVSTKELMVTFYEELKNNPKSEALRKAQQKLINSDYSHPFFWAPFILIGEWR